jgi:LAO/AO transport system kinase
VQNEGIEDLWIRVRQHRKYLERSGELEERRRARLEREVLEVAERRLRQHVLLPRVESEAFKVTLDRVLRREMDPYQAAEQIVPRPVTSGK